RILTNDTIHRRPHEPGKYQMKNWFLDNQRLKRASQYGAAVILCALILCFLLKLWRAEPRMPFHYRGDSLLHAMFTKGIVENGWYWENPSLGAPNQLLMYDFPAVDNSVAVILVLIGLFTDRPFLILNIFYLLTFPLTTISSLYVLRQFNLSYAPALFASLLFTFLPYHFMRGETHLFLSAYYFIPLVVMVLLWAASDQLSDERRRFGINLRSQKFIAAVVICILVGSNGIYYPFFACFLLLVAGISGAVIRRNVRPFAAAVLLVVVTFAAVVINLAPSIVYIYKHGDAGVTQRSVAGPEIYGLKISQLLLPISGHRVGPLNTLKERYNQQTVVTESDAASLGLIGSIGFLVLLAHLFFPRQGQNSTLADLSLLNLFAVLLATIGGFTSLFALFVSAGLRSNNRISVFIAFFSLLTVALGLEFFYQRRVRSRAGSVLFHVLLGFVFVAAILDQTSRGYVPPYEQVRAEFESDERFIAAAEASLPAGAMVFQLPYVPFPESPPVNRMVDYDHLRGYMHSFKLRWSYGAMKNRPYDLWQREIASLPVEEMVRSLAFAGVRAIYFDRHGYSDQGAAMEAQLRALLQDTPSESNNGRLLMFDMTGYNSRLREQYSESEWQTKQDQSLHPLILDWRGGFSGLESSAEKTWRWCSSEGELRIYNTSQRARRVSLEMSFASGYEQFDDLIISGLISDQIKTNATPAAYSKTITLPPGISIIRFVSTGRRVDAPLDPRVLIFRIENFKLQELD
ncbi:MAG TPA: hypothetical protein VHH35_17865, partial [Pyrinomonadaceae bacterium]|nr:hypothetical protein [Pyrinomonadaceae bacterium]